MYSTRVHARIPNGHPCELRGQAHVGQNPRTLSDRLQPLALLTRRLLREDPRAEVDKEVRVGVRVGVRGI